VNSPEIHDTVIISDGGPWYFHDRHCDVYPGEKAIFDAAQGRFHPSWRAQSEGWMLVRPPKWLRWFLRPEWYVTDQKTVNFLTGRAKG
jgi:hypothetical protein